MIAEATRVQKQKLREAIDEQSEIILKAQKERIAADTQLRVQQETVVAQAAIRKSEDLAKDEALAHAKGQRKKLEKEFYALVIFLMQNLWVLIILEKLKVKKSEVMKMYMELQELLQMDFGHLVGWFGNK